MKNILIATAALATAAALPQPARADHDNALAAIGGFIGGVIVGSHIDHHDRYDAPPAVCPPPRYEAPRGHWEDRQVRVWVPAHTEVSYDRCGVRIVHTRPGFYTYRTDRVWVVDERHDHGRAVVVTPDRRWDRR